MGFFGRSKEEERKGKKLVVTGKRVRGAWSMESKIALAQRSSASAQTAQPAGNRRVRTLH